MNEIILKEQNGQVVVSSRDVAEKFGKRHANVIRDIEDKIEVNSILSSPKYFTESTYLDKSNRQSKEYLMTRDGFSFLVMGFNRKDADIWKIKYIEAFNQMEEQLKEHQPKLPTTYKEALVQLLEEVEKNEQLEEERKVLLPKADYHDNVLNKKDLLTTTMIAKDLGITARALNNMLVNNKILFKQSNTYYPYSKYQWLITENYADYKIYEDKNYKEVLKWTEKGRKWIIENICNWN